MENLSKKKPGPKPTDLVGKKFNFLTVVGKAPDKGKKVRWLCLCDCGKKTVTQACALTSNHTKSCGCRGKGRASGFINQMFANYRIAAQRRDYDFQLSQSEFSDLVKQNCHYCKSSPASKENRADVKRGAFREVIAVNGVDRRDNDIGYVLANCVSCCSICNRTKKDMPYAEFVVWIERLRLV